MTAADLADFAGIDPPIAADTGARSSSYLLLGKHGSQVRVSASAQQLLALAAAYGSAERIAAELTSRFSHPVRAEDIQRKLDGLLGVLDRAEARAARDELPSGFWLRLRLASDATVTRLCRGLSWAFHPAAAAALLLVVALSLVTLFAGAGLRAAGDSAFWPAYALFFVSLLFHELGHAAACQRYGAPPSEIGLTVYLVFPALYSDVSSAWRLRRWQRAVVDLGGAYFQLAVGALYIGAYRVCGEESLHTAALLILYTNLFSLNPVFKFDGYWLIADVLGVTNLSRQPARLLRHVADLVRRRPSRPLPWKPWVVVVLGAYSLASCGVWVYFLWRLAPWLVEQLYALPGQGVALRQAAGLRDGAAVVGAARHLLISAGTLVLAAMTLLGTARNAIRTWTRSKATAQA